MNEHDELTEACSKAIRALGDVCAVVNRMNVPAAPAPSDVSADEVERARQIADILHKVQSLHTSLRIPAAEYVPAIPEAWTKLEGIARAVNALTHRSAAAKVPSVEELEKVYLDAHFRTPKGYIDSDDKSHRAGIAAVRALFVGGVQ